MARTLSESTFPRPARMAELAPDVRVLPVDVRRIPRLVVTEIEVLPDGRVRALDRVYDAWMRASEAAERLPFGLSKEVILNLGRAGFIKTAQPAPDNITVSISSILEHIAAEQAEHPDYWTHERRERYRAALRNNDGIRTGRAESKREHHEKLKAETLKS